MHTDFKLYEATEDYLGNLQVDETVWLDKGFCNESLVTIVKFYGKYYCRVRDVEGYEWNTMIYRLSKP